MKAELRVESMEARTKEWRRRTTNELFFDLHPFSLFLLDSKNNFNWKSEIKKEEKRKTFSPSHEARETDGKKFSHLSQRTMMMHRASRMGTKAVERAVGWEWESSNGKESSEEKISMLQAQLAKHANGRRKNGRMDGFKHLSELIFELSINIANTY